MTQAYSDAAVQDLVSAPIILLSAPRSGSTLLFEQLAMRASLWSIGGESHAVLMNFPHLRAENSSLDSMALSERHADPETAQLFRRCFLALLLNHQRQPFLRLPADQRPVKPIWIEKTPRNALNIPFLLSVFPEARFVYLYRDPRQTISSLIEAWELGMKTGRFVTFRQLPGWHLPAWCFLLPSAWRTMIGKSISEIAAFQWAACQDAIVTGLEALPNDRHICLDYADFIQSPEQSINRIYSAFDIGRDDAGPVSMSMPLSKTTVSAPSPDKWRRHETEIEAVLPDIETTILRAQTFLGAS